MKRRFFIFFVYITQIIILKIFLYICLPLFNSAAEKIPCWVEKILEGHVRPLQHGCGRKGRRRKSNMKFSSARRG
jgi:hypothetical protein